MRIRFAPLSKASKAPDGDEARALSALRDRVDAFWLDAADRIARAGSQADRETLRRLERDVTGAARRAAPGIRVEIDVIEGGERRVFVMPESETGGEPLAAEFVARAPRVPRLSVARFRPDLDAKAAVLDVRERLGVDLERARVRIGFSRGHLLEAVVYSPSFSSAADEPGLAAAHLLVARLLGEEMLHDFIGSIDVAPLPRGGSLRVVADAPTTTDATLPLGDVLPAAEAAVRGLYAELPDTPYHTFCERAEWTMLELSPELADDYGEKDDLALVSTMLPEATKCFLQGSPFSSVRFSKHGERFAYLKLDTRGRSPVERHELRIELEDALNSILVPGGVGCVVGAGIGARYVYLDLALENLDHGVRIACDRVRKVGKVDRGWALFCDTGWEDEWVAIGDQTPPPRAPERSSSGEA